MNYIPFKTINFVKKEENHKNNPDDEGSFYVPITILIAFLLIFLVIVSLLIIISFNVFLYFLDISTHPLKLLIP
jgi:hypothetical protein